MRLIKLTQGKSAKVDNSDYGWLSVWKWSAHKKKHTYYAVRTEWIDGKPKSIYMHRLILDTPKGKRVDHKDHNGLNCQRKNIRNCSNSQNQANKKPSGVSIYLGVSKGSKNRFRAGIKKDGKYRHLGSFVREVDAALTYDIAAKILHGEFANLNFIEK